MGALTRQMAAFARHKAALGGTRGSGLAAAKAAGYRGSDAVLRVQASKLMKDGRILAEIARIRAAATDLQAPAGAESAAIAQIDTARRVQAREIEVATLTLNRKLLILAEIAEDQEAKDSDRIRAVELASKLDGDLGNGTPGEAAIAAAAASASGAAAVVVWVGNARGPAPVVGGD